MRTWAQKKKHSISPYIYQGEDVLSVIPSMQAPPLEKMFRDKVYGKVEYLVLEALYRYPYLNQHNLSRYLDLKLGVQKWTSYRNVIDRLKEDGVILQILYADYHFYTLSQEGISYISAKKGFHTSPVVERPPVTGQQLLSCASLAQWHLSLQDKKLQDASFYQRRKFGKVKGLVYSYAAYNTAAYHYHLFSLPLPKGPDTDFFLEQLDFICLAYNKTFHGKRDICLTVFIASSLADMEGAEAFLRSYRPFMDRTPYYALEANCADLNGLSCLYYYVHSDKTDRLKTICLI